MNKAALQDLQTRLDYQFQDLELLIKALTHSSTGHNKNYERLEFLGDRVLGLVIAQMLFETFPKDSEGDLAKRHSALVQGSTLADIALEQQVGHALILSQAERESGGAENENILADVMESMLAALYLDGGLEPVQRAIKTWWGDRINTLQEPPQDPKTALQEWVQARGQDLPVYDIIDRQGPDHAPIFTIEVRVDGDVSVSAQGASRRSAEKEAAKIMLEQLQSGAKS